MRLSMSFRFCALRTQCQQAAKQVNLAPWSGVATIGQPARCRTHRLVSIAKRSQVAIYGGGRALPRPKGVPFRGPPARKAPGKSYEERKYRPLQSRFLRQGLPPPLAERHCRIGGDSDTASGPTIRDACRHARSLGTKSSVRATRCFADRLDAIATPMASAARSQPPLSSRLGGNLEYANHVIRYSSEEFQYMFAESNACVIGSAESMGREYIFLLGLSLNDSIHREFPSYGSKVMPRSRPTYTIPARHAQRQP